MGDGRLDLGSWYGLAVVGWGLAPSEFWKLTMSELYWLLKFHHPEETGAKVGGIARDEFEAMRERLEELGD